jgi:hypothetical protein
MSRELPHREVSGRTAIVRAGPVVESVDLTADIVYHPDATTSSFVDFLGADWSSQ